MPNNFRHAAIADLLIACPHMTKGEIAYELGYTQSYLSILMSSDAFQMYLAQRRGYLEEDIDAAAAARLAELNRKADEIIQKELESEDPSPHFALSVKKVLKPDKKPSITLNQHIENMKRVQNNTQINQTVLERARDKLKQFRRDPDDIVEAVLEN